MGSFVADVRHFGFSTFSCLPSPLPSTHHFAMAQKYGAVRQHADDDTAAATASPPPSLAATVNTNNKMLVATLATAVFVGCFLLLASATSLDTLGRVGLLHSLPGVTRLVTWTIVILPVINRFLPSYARPSGVVPPGPLTPPGVSVLIAKLRREVRQCHRPSRLLRQPPRSRKRSSPRVSYGTIGRPCSSRPCPHGRGERYKSNAVDDDLAA
jgi:hypothetical protein